MFFPVWTASISSVPCSSSPWWPASIILSDTLQAGSGPINECPVYVFSSNRPHHTFYVLAPVSFVLSCVQPASLETEGYSVSFSVCHSSASRTSRLRI
jgi:hypothetical protein